MKILSELLNKKRIVLVGPSKSIVDSNQHDIIESFDLVVRMNFGWPVPKYLHSDMGKRLDILYHCCNPDRPIEKLFIPEFEKVKFVCWEKGVQSLKMKDYCDKHNIPSLDITPIYKNLTKKLNTFPNTGTVAIHHLLSFNIKELYITGISFFQEPYYSKYPGDGAIATNWKNNTAPKQIWQHLFEPQLTYFYHLLNKDKRIKVDLCLKNIVKQLN